jgi:hypothetical protein
MLKARELSTPNLMFIDEYALKRAASDPFLQAVKADACLRTAPVVLLVGSVAGPEEITEAYNHCVACVVTLPEEIEQRLCKIRIMLEFWTTHAELPELLRWWRPI